MLVFKTNSSLKSLQMFQKNEVTFRKLKLFFDPNESSDCHQDLNKRSLTSWAKIRIYDSLRVISECYSLTKNNGSLRVLCVSIMKCIFWGEHLKARLAAPFVVGGFLVLRNMMGKSNGDGVWTVLLTFKVYIIERE